MKSFLRWIFLLLTATMALQVFFVARVALMRWVDPSSTAFERTQMLAVWRDKGQLNWRQSWMDYTQMGDAIKRAVIASEDGAFVQHDGVDWDAMERAWERNHRAAQQAQVRGPRQAPGNPIRPPKIVGGSTITQQLAKNLFFSGERSFLRKGEELVVTYALELLLGKERILELYLNHVEWGVGVFGIEAAAQHYFRKAPRQLSAWEAARLAVMLPRPRHFERLPQSSYLASRASVIQSRMADVELP